MLRTRLTLKPGRPGTLEMLEQYGSKLVCVRYRYDDELEVRYKTVELIVEERAWTPPPTQPPPSEVQVSVEQHEFPLRQALLLMGAQYNPTTETWLIPYTAATTLQLANRITPTTPANISTIDDQRRISPSVAAQPPVAAVAVDRHVRV
jgi:hypothetical protein